MLNSAARWLAPTAARFPERVAVEDEWGMTWRELEEAVERSPPPCWSWVWNETSRCWSTCPRAGRAW